MALAIIYIFATAKPFSIRRLTALFVSVLLMATPFLEIVHVRNVRNDALTIAALLTLLVWITPLVGALRDTVRNRSLSLDALRPVSVFVLWTYGFALTAAPITAVSEALNPTRGLHLGVLLGVLAIASFVALLLRAGSHSPVVHDCSGKFAFAARLASRSQRPMTAACGDLNPPRHAVARRVPR
jgi:hypothetical protein